MKAIRIDIHGKYIIQVPEGTPDEEVAFLGKQLAEWMNDPHQPIMVAPSKYKIVKARPASGWLNSVLARLGMS